MIEAMGALATIMNKKRQKSAKDIAFDQERACFRRQIREVETQLRETSRQLKTCEETIRQKDDLIRQKDEWIARLLEYTNLSKEEMEKFIETEKKKTEIAGLLRDMDRMFGRLLSCFDQK